MADLTDHEQAAGIKDERPARFVPPFPERTGYHWIRRYRGSVAIPLWWNADWNRNGGEGWGRMAEPNREFNWEYCGPCPSPDDKQSASAEEEDRNP